MTTEERADRIRRIVEIDDQRKAINDEVDRLISQEMSEAVIEDARDFIEDASQLSAESLAEFLSNPDHEGSFQKVFGQLQLTIRLAYRPKISHHETLQKIRAEVMQQQDEEE